MHTQRDREIEFNLNARVQPRVLANYRYRTAGREGVLLSLIKLATDLGGENLPFRRLSLYDVLAYSNFPSFLISFPLCLCHLAYYVTSPIPTHSHMTQRFCEDGCSMVSPHFCSHSASFIPTNINYVFLNHAFSHQYLMLYSVFVCFIL